jgi:hypothetical protein
MRYCPGLLRWPIGIVVGATIPIANMQDATQADDEDCTITGIETEHGPACSINSEPLFDEALLSMMQASWHSHRTSAYTDKEYLMLCSAWLFVGTDPISSAEQKGGTFWWRIFMYFHEHRKFKPDKVESDRNEVSLSKQWGFIQLECNRFCGALENVKKRKQCGHGVSELVRYFLLV